ncbi:N-formylglutamate amidohydrolase [Maricaulis salignorans]|uniref:N-formylglutamate amidohydrolase n=1 Tax=Maricaulis salignorans TaxID=144026 RepID=A0A1G9PTD0_9PROT|nr:N-formylglutamate amidohydrolase [Maricaulis salignorans]SDM01385.1 N-formylglutamate amidohydrolase [Maricaulis salignorans]
MLTPRPAAPAFRLCLPEEAATLPLVLDSPHSGTALPPGFQTLATREQQLTAWDAFIPDLWRGAVAAGASLIEADFARIVIDPNRAVDDIDPDMVDGAWPLAWGKLAPTRYSARGMGLIRKLILPGLPMYAGPLTPQEIHQRIDTLYTPYHCALADRLDALHARFGAVWHIDCHSMKSRANAMNIDLGQARPDIVLGDLDGSSAAAEFTDLVECELRACGYSVARNQPYKGGDIVRRHGDPARDRHSLQIEINRALYLDETRFEPSPGFDQLQRDLTRLAQAIATDLRARIQPGQSR